MDYTARERTWLGMLAIASAGGLNGVFLWAVVRQPEAVWSALRNPVAAAFIAEAFVLMGLLAYLLRRWRVTRVPWGWFVVLSLAGGLAFAIPAVLLWAGKEPGTPERSRPGRVL